MTIDALIIKNLHMLINLTKFLSATPALCLLKVQLYEYRNLVKLIDICNVVKYDQLNLSNFLGLTGAQKHASMQILAIWESRKLRQGFCLNSHKIIKMDRRNFLSYSDRKNMGGSAAILIFVIFSTNQQFLGLGTFNNTDRGLIMKI